MAKIIILLSVVFLFQVTVSANEEYYLTLRSDKVNLRQGPSLEHAIKLIYKKKFLPVLVIDKSYNFRKIIDHENNSGWIHISQLSKKKAAINYDNKAILFKKPTFYSKPIAYLEKGRLCLVKKCNLKWCKVKTDKFTGWVEKKNLKGRI